MKKFIVTPIIMLLSVCAFAQSNSFKQAQWIEIHNGIMKQLTRNYVDSLPLDRMYKDGIDKMLGDLDPYTVFVPESEQEDFEMMISNTYGGIGAVIYKPDVKGYVVINEPYENSPAGLAGLRCGDEILEIDGLSTIGLTASEASSRMKGKPGTSVNFKIKRVRSGETLGITIIREKIQIPSIDYCGMLDAKTGYIALSGFTEGVSGQLAEAIGQLKGQGMEKLVLDLRGNGGGLLDEAVKIVSLFVPKGTLVVTSKGSDGSREYKTATEPVDTLMPLLVLVDSGSASASEIVSGAIQDLDRGTVAGVRTFGKGLVQRVMPLPYNAQLKVTVAKYYTPSGRCVQAKDYSHRNEDGSVGNIPDSLTHEFKTAKGRTVRDGGGITPDIVVEAESYDRVTYAAALSGILSNYTIEFARKHESIPALENFNLSDEEYEAFASWAAEQKFDCRTESETYYDMLVRQLKKDKMYDELKAELDSVEKIVKMDKKAALMHSKKEILPLLEEEIAVRYYFQKAGVQVRLKTDTQLKTILSKWN